MNFGLVRRNPDWDLIGCVWHFGGCVVPGRAAGSPERQVKSLPRVLILPVLLASFCCFIGKRFSESHALTNICVSTLSAPLHQQVAPAFSAPALNNVNRERSMSLCLPALYFSCHETSDQLASPPSLMASLLLQPATYKDTVHLLMKRFYDF